MAMIFSPNIVVFGYYFGMDCTVYYIMLSVCCCLFQFQGDIYYRSHRPIYPGTEVLVSILFVFNFNLLTLYRGSYLTGPCIKCVDVCIISTWISCFLSQPYLSFQKLPGPHLRWVNFCWVLLPLLVKWVTLIFLYINVVDRELNSP